MNAVPIFVLIAVVALSMGAVVMSAVSIQAFSSCGQRRVVALTFDGGPSTNKLNAPAVLDDLKKFGIKATFFTTPDNDGDGELAARCELVRRIVSEGHSTQMMSWSHPDMTNLSKDQFDSQITKTADWLYSCGVPAGNVTQFRPPYGILSWDQSDYIYNKWGYVTAMWNVLPNDFGDKSEDADTIFKRVVEKFNDQIGEGNSAIIELHDNMYIYHPGLVEKLYSHFSSMNYSFVTTDECYQQCKPRTRDDDRIVCSGPGGPNSRTGTLVP